MGRFLLVLILGSAIVAGIAWGFDLLPKSERKEKVPEPMSTPKIEFGNPLFPNAKQSVAEPVFNGTGKGLPTIVIQAHLAVMDKSDAAPQVEGQILFVGEIVPDEAVALGGVAAFSADPFSNAKVNRGTGDLIVMYRRLLEDEPLRADQNVAMLDPAKAMQEAAIRKAKVKVAEFDYEAAYKVFKEADKRYDIALKLRREGGPKVIGDEELREKQLGSEKFELEAQSKKEAIQVAINEERQALTVLRQHYVRNPTGKASKIKTIYHSRGDSVKNLEPIMTVFSTDNMMAEGMVDVQYRHRLMLDMPVIVEPTQQEPPHHIFRGHTMEINGVAVSKGPRPLFVSVSDDKKAYVWQAGQDYPVRVLPHADAV
ncbi:MAG TPA: WD40 repeat domain-containing protein, partial [Gemmataceae bacterium]|nr:WD40 repeat domain-containing protein [Gemmataceae bacterium]